MNFNENTDIELENSEIQKYKTELDVLHKKIQYYRTNWNIPSPIDSSLKWLNGSNDIFWNLVLHPQNKYTVPWISEKQSKQQKKYREWDKPLFYNCRLTTKLWAVAFENAETNINWKTTYKTHKETYYSEKVLPWNSLKIPWRHTASDWTVRDNKWYICVAANYLPKWSTVMTTLWPGKVYDTWEALEWAHIDIYTNR